MDSLPVQQDINRIADSLNAVRVDPISIITAVVVVLASVLLARYVRRWILRFGESLNVTSEGVLRLAARLVSYTIGVIGVIAGLRVIGIDLGPVVAALGFSAVIAAVALRPFLENAAAGITMQLQRPVEVESQGRIAGIEGTVVDITTRAVVLETPDGEIVYIPNSSAVTSPITNFTKLGKRRTAINVGLAYGTDLSVAARTLTEATAATPGVLADPPPEALIHEFGDSTINAAVRYWHGPEIRTGWTTRHDVATNIKSALDAAGIEIAFPQRVISTAESNGEE